METPPHDVGAGGVLGSTRAQGIALGVALGVALLGLIALGWWALKPRAASDLAAGEGANAAERADRTAYTPVDLPDVVSDGPDAPAAEAFPELAASSDPRAADPAARAQVAADVAKWSGELSSRVAANDWEAVREATDALRKSPALTQGAIDALTERVAGAEALALGVALEELVAEQELDADRRAEIGEALVPRLVTGLASGAFADDAAAHALRLLSRFPGDDAEAAYLAILGDPRASLDMRRYALFGLAEAGTPRAVAPVRNAFYNAASPEVARVAALALARLAARHADAALASEVRREIAPRLYALLGALGDDADPDEIARITDTLAGLADLASPHYLVAVVLPDRKLPIPIRRIALELIEGYRDLSVLDRLRALVGALGDPDLDALCEAALARLQALSE